MLKKVIDYIESKLLKSANIPCRSYLCGNPVDGQDYDCEYENAPDCGDCVCVPFGTVSPETGRELGRIPKYLKLRMDRKIYLRKNTSAIEKEI